LRRRVYWHRRRC